VSYEWIIQEYASKINQKSVIVPLKFAHHGFMRLPVLEIVTHIDFKAHKDTIVVLQREDAGRNCGALAWLPGKTPIERYFVTL